MFARAVGVVVVGLSLLCSMAAVRAAELVTIDDSATGVRLALPANLIARRGRGTYGTSWRRRDRQLQIETIRLSPDRNYRAYYEALKAINGRDISRDEFGAAGFQLEGRDADGGLFVILMNKSGSEKRGLSIVYSARGGRSLRRVVDQIIESFRPFPTGGVTPPDAQPAAPLVSANTKLDLAALNGTLWRHNGSIMRMTTSPRSNDSGSIVITYRRVRPGLRRTIRNGARLIVARDSSTGTIQSISGTARIFKRGCRPAAYRVNGSFTGPNKRKLILKGASPRWRGCRIKGYSRNSSNARLVFTRMIPVGEARVAGGSNPMGRSTSRGARNNLVSTVRQRRRFTKPFGTKARRLFAEARQILAAVSREPKTAYRRWAAFALAARKLRLAVGRRRTTSSLKALFKKFPTSPLHSELWGIIPMGIIASLKDNNYYTGYIYGEKTKYPGIRQEMIDFLKNHPNDNFAFAAYYGTGAFEKAIVKNSMGISLGMLHYAAAHKELSVLLERVIPQLDEPKVVASRMRKRSHACTTRKASGDCYFFQKFTVHGAYADDRLNAFLRRADASDPTKVLNALQANETDLRKILYHLDRATMTGRLPHKDDAHYYQAVIYEHLGQRDKAIAQLDAAMSIRNKYGDLDDYGYAARSLIIRILLKTPEKERIAIVKNYKAFSREPALWYVIARDAYRRHDYSMTIKIATLGLKRLGVPAWRLPVSTQSKRIENEIKRALGKESNYYVDVNLSELVYLLNAAREMDRFTKAISDQSSSVSINPKRIRSLILKYSLLSTSKKERKALYAGTLKQHRDLRQAIHLAELVLRRAPASDTSEFKALREWLLYRRVRMLVHFKPKRVQAAVAALESAFPRSALIDDAYAELLFTQAFKLKAPAATANTFQLINKRFPSGNALDNAYSWYAIFLRCKKDYQNARRINMEIIRRFPLTRHAVYAAKRLSQPDGCGYY